MKKYIYLVLATLLIISSIVMTGYALKGTPASVETFILKPQDMENTITSSGKLQYKSGKSVKLNEFGIMKEVYVKSGDEVKKGDRLFSYYRSDMAEQYADIGNILTLPIKEQALAEVKKYCTVKEFISDTDGKVSSVLYNTDDIIQKNSDVIKFSDTGVIEVPVNINENYIERVKTGQTAEIKFNAVPDKEYTGKVTKISDEAVQTTGLSGKETTVCVTVTLDEKKDDKLRIGYSADCSIITSTDKNILVVPYDCIHSDDKGDYVLTLVKSRSKKAYITTGREYKDGVEILSGLNKGDKIISN